MSKFHLYRRAAVAVFMLLLCAAGLCAGVPFPENSAAAGYDTESIKGSSIKVGTISINVTEEASFRDGRYYMTGNVVFPYFLPGVYRGREEVLEEFCMDEEGAFHISHEMEKKSFTVPALDDGFSFRLKDGRLVVDGDSVFMEFPDAALYLPLQYGDDGLKLEGVVYRLSGNRLDFDFSCMKYVPSAELVMSGLPVTVAEVSFIPEVLPNGWTTYRLFLGGSVTVVEDGRVPEFLKGGKLPFAAVLDGKGSLCSFDTGIDDASGSIATEAFPLTAASLRNAGMSLSFLDSSVFLIAEDGVLVMDGAVPDWLKGRELAVTSFMYDFRKREYKAVEARSAPFDLDMEPVMKNAVVTLSYASDGTSAITVAGTLEKKLQVSSVFTEAPAGPAAGVVTLSLDGTPVSMRLIQEY